jgi:hypothetical protein
MQSVYKHILVLFAVGIFATGTFAQQGNSDEPINILIQWNDKTATEIKTELEKAGVPQEVIEALQIEATLEYLESVKDAEGVGSLPFESEPTYLPMGYTPQAYDSDMQGASISTNLSCVSGRFAQAWFSTSGSGAVSSVYSSSHGSLGKSDFCTQSDGCFYSHTAGGVNPPIAIFRHQAVGNGIFYDYLTPNGAICL